MEKNKKNNKQKNIIESYENTCEVNTKEENISLYLPKLPNYDEFTVLADFFSVFSDTTRLKIISVLSEKELCVHEYG